MKMDMEMGMIENKPLFSSEHHEALEFTKVCEEHFRLRFMCVLLCHFFVFSLFKTDISWFINLY